jgi:hypothetical protein
MIPNRIRFWLMFFAFARPTSARSSAPSQGTDQRPESTMQLWAIIPSPAVIGSFLASFDDEALVVCALGGEGLLRWIQALDAAVESFVRDQGCSEMRVAGARPTASSWAMPARWTAANTWTLDDGTTNIVTIEDGNGTCCRPAL